MAGKENITAQEALESGIIKENVYARQRRALREMEEGRNGELRSGYYTEPWEHPVRF